MGFRGADDLRGGASVFFSGRALYIFLEGTRSGGNQSIDSQTDWFMRSAELFGGGSPMMYVQNQHEDFAKSISYDKYREHYPFLDQNHYCVNLKSKRGVQKLKRAIREKIAEHDSVGMMLPHRWYQVRERIAELAKKAEAGTTKDPIDIEDFEEICRKQGIENREAQLQLARYFHRLGVFLYYDDENFIALKDKIILNRNWATKATYQVYDDEKIEKRKGRFGKADINRLWNEPEFKKHKTAILELMETFLICFKLPDGQNYIVPRRLDDMPTGADYCLRGREEVPFFYYYEYDFMPAGVVNALSIRKNELIKGENKECVWADGVVFEIPEKNLLAEIREKRLGGEQKIEIRIVGDDIPFMADTINLELDKINAGLNQERLRIDVKIPCICPRCQREKKGKYFFDYNLVKGHLLNPEQNETEIQCQKSLQRVKMYELVRGLSHRGVDEINEAKKQRQNRQRGMGKIMEGVGELHEDMHDLTMRAVRAENHKQTDEIKSEVLDKILPAVRQVLNDSDKKLLTKILPKLEEAELHREHTNNLIEMVDKAMRKIYQSQVANFSVNKNVENACRQVQKVKTDDSDFVDKLKVTIPLIPFILTYSGELSSPNLLQDVKKMWKEGGWKRLFVEKV